MKDAEMKDRPDGFGVGLTIEIERKIPGENAARRHDIHAEERKERFRDGEVGERFDPGGRYSVAAAD